MERTERIARTIRFLNDAFQDSDYLSAHPDAKAYRLEHTYRVAHIGCAIAEAEGMDAEAMTIGCLLHDVSYCLPFDSDDAVLEHGRRSARMARPLLETFDLAPETLEAICYGIAIHVDDKADFAGERTPFALTISDADNIDRFDAYRIYDILRYLQYDSMTLDEKRVHVEKVLTRSEQYFATPLATATATRLWKERLQFRIAFYQRLKEQIETSTPL